MSLWPIGARFALAGPPPVQNFAIPFSNLLRTPHAFNSVYEGSTGDNSYRNGAKEEQQDRGQHQRQACLDDQGAHLLSPLPATATNHRTVWQGHSWLQVHSQDAALWQGQARHHRRQHPPSQEV